VGWFSGFWRHLLSNWVSDITVRELKPVWQSLKLFNCGLLIGCLYVGYRIDLPMSSTRDIKTV